MSIRSASEGGQTVGTTETEGAGVGAAEGEAVGDEDGLELGAALLVGMADGAEEG